MNIQNPAAKTHPEFVHDPRVKTRGISMNDAMYEACLEIAGTRNFSSWIRDLLQLEISRYRNIKGRVPGGACDSGLGCANTGSWYLHTLKHNYWCKECFSKSNSQFLFIDKSPVTEAASNSQREQLIQAAKNAMSALVEFDRVSPSTEPLNIPVDIAAAVASARRED